MRVFEDIKTAALEIGRDLSKSPLITTSRVQHMSLEGEQGQLREATCYTYTVKDMPEKIEDIILVGLALGFYKEDDLSAITMWLHQEIASRLTWTPGLVNELYHPNLASVLEGDEPSYAYTDRLNGAVTFFVETLAKDMGSRRAFWPIFRREDSERAPRMTRIPCSIGYQLLIREVNDVPMLHMVYLQRSCDFNRFWLSDVWLARQFQRRVLAKLRAVMYPDLELGHFTHNITSFHSFVTQEIY